MSGELGQTGSKSVRSEVSDTRGWFYITVSVVHELSSQTSESKPSVFSVCSDICEGAGLYLVHLSLRCLLQGVQDDVQVLLELAPDGQSDVAKRREDLRLHRPVHILVLQTEQRLTSAHLRGSDR